MSEFQRKIELQSLDDLQYLVSNIQQAARDKIDKDLPPLEGEDPMRKRVETIVSKYIGEVVANISANITINGLEPTGSLVRSILQPKAMAALEVEEHEPFNSRLFEQAQKLARQEEDLIEEIAMLRRTVPQKVTDAVKIEFQNDIEKDEAIIRTLQERIESSEIGHANLGVEALEREDIIKRDWNKGIRGLGILMRSMPEMVAKKVRAEEAEAFVIQDNRR